MTPSEAAELVERAIQQLPQGPVLVAIDGASAAGTSTLADTLGKRLSATVVRGDDFYRDMPAEQRRALTAEQGYASYFDWQRMRDEALEPLHSGRTATYHPFDWATGSGLANAPVALAPSDVVLVDGVYSARPELQDLYALTVLVQTPDETRLSRRVARGHNHDEWWSRWEAAEQHYFTNVRRPDAYDLVLPGH